MDNIDRKISEILQLDGKLPLSELAAQTGVAVSTVNDRLRRLVSAGVIRGWRAILAPERVGAALCAFLWVDMEYEGEEAAVQALVQLDEVMELHHVSGPHSYLVKVRVRDVAHLQRFLAEQVKPLAAVTKTETILSMDTLKETSVVKISQPE
jgi:Lrp/AsnC family leucine-responsive transcriptional regulator